MAKLKVIDHSLQRKAEKQINNNICKIKMTDEQNKHKKIIIDTASLFHRNHVRNLTISNYSRSSV